MEIIINVENDIELQEIEQKQLEEFATRMGFKVIDIKQIFDEIGKEFYISYRGEFEAVVIAKNEEEAKEKFKNGNAEIKCVGNLWEEYMKIESDD